MWCSRRFYFKPNVEQLVWDCLPVYHPCSNWAAQRLEWRWETAGDFDWYPPLPHHPHPPAVFQLSQTTTVAHHSLSVLCISTRFHISSSSKSEPGCPHTHPPPPYAASDPGPTTRSPQTSLSSLHIFMLNFAGSLHCWPRRQEWCQPQTNPA